MGENRWVAPGRDTFAKLLALNAGRFADRPASREKMYGIWQSWTWVQAAEEIRQIHEQTRKAMEQIRRDAEEWRAALFEQRETAAEMNETLRAWRDTLT